MPRYTFFCIKKEHEKKPFLPRLNREKQRLETSIYLVERFTDEEIWRVGQSCVAETAQTNENQRAERDNRKPQQFRLLGRFDFDSDCLSQHNIALVIETDNNPSNGHSNLLGWSEEPALGKPQNEDTAKRLKETYADYINFPNRA